MTGLTGRQESVYRFIYETARDQGRQPTLREVGARFGFTVNSSLCHVRALARKGFVEPAGGSSRSVRFLLTPSGRPFRGFRDSPEETRP